MKPLVLVILAVMWLVVLLPPFLRSVRDGRPSDSVTSFRRQLTVLERTAPGTPVSRAPLGVSGPAVSTRARLSYERRRAQERRRNLLFGLVGSSAVFTLLGLVTGARLLLGLGGVSLLLLAGYVWLLLQWQAQRARAMAVRAIGVLEPVDDPGFTRSGR